MNEDGINKSIMMFFMGLSGAGKDTQAGLIREFLKKKDGNPTDELAVHQSVLEATGLAD